jgi:hypothetical protein
MEEWCGDREGGFQKIFDALPKLSGEYGWYHLSLPLKD